MDINNKVIIEKMITIDNTGMPKAPDIRQLQDKDILLLWSRDMTSDKRRYLGDAGVIYYMGDPKSPPRQRGFSDKECLRDAIENYNLDKDYKPDALVIKLTNKYYINNVTEAGIALQSLQQSIHLCAIGATRINELLNNELSTAITKEDVTSILTLIDSVNKRIIEIPNLTKALGTAYENLRNEREEQLGRGKQVIQSSMDADEED